MYVYVCIYVFILVKEVHAELLRQLAAQITATLKTSQGQIDGLFSQLQSKFHLSEVASVGDWFRICPWVASRVALSE